MEHILKSSLWFIVFFLGLLLYGSDVVAGATDREVYDLEQMWRIEGNEDEFIIGIIDDAVADEHGRFYMLDHQLSQICVVDQSGGFVGFLGREGEGPGEFVRPSSIAWWGDGMLAVAQASPGRLTLISTEGVPGGAIHYSRSGERLTTGIQRVEPYSDGFIIQASYSMSNGTIINREKQLVRCDRKGQELGIVMEYELTQNTENFIMDEKLLTPPWAEWVCRENGELIWVDDRDQYSLSISSSIGSRESFAHRDYPGWARSDAMVDSLKEDWESDVRMYFQNVKAVIEKAEPVIIKLLRGPSEQIWVVTSRNHKEKRKDALIEAEVHGPDGSWLGMAEMLLPEGMAGGELLALDWPFALVRFQVDEDDASLPDSTAGNSCVPVYAAFHLRKREAGHKE
ncbi:MAG: hypothetical protein KJ970_02540 [Candidatus Eisenbacteria bacterium]|uniref:6-bladed beta-propeller n=1 Tax=Eiseniibacteriota bacterium TaxID=2212470 RepID=A0A948RUM3_UNCEI|nr:hypothetical protein [Candidatus Eisenbacteria bacterium]MBU1951046.1 hypothetical protein [Candidatus Eisenbacteria bacterium]MBU2689777.1 hypothetical protein [Candidatus Eisenbacteria bacterium]